MTLDEIEQKIHQYYRHFAEIAAGVRVQEAGDLASLWLLWERETRNAIRSMTGEQAVAEFGWVRAREEGLV